MLDAATLARALLAMPPREAQVVLHAMVEGSALEPAQRLPDGTTQAAGARSARLAELYGITGDAADVLLYRSAVALSAALSSQSVVITRDEEERQHASALRVALTDAARSPPTNPAADALLALEEHGAEVRALLAKAEAEAETSPARARETWSRWAAIAVIVALTAFFYWREATKPLPPPQPRPALPQKTGNPSP